MTVYDEDGSVRDVGFMSFWIHHRENEAPRHELVTCWWGPTSRSDWCFDGWWDEPDYSGFGGGFFQLFLWDGWYKLGHRSPYDDFEGYYYAPGNFVYGYVEPRGEDTRFFFYGD